jgi:class 3 adenylate cyclase/alpha-beta hydrolase superfamily lysophospholipase
VRPETRYVEVEDAAVAYQVVGADAPHDDVPDLVYITGVTSHVDLRWESPRFAHFLQQLASFSRLILFDRRGSGASDSPAHGADLTWEQWAEDLLAVMDATASRQAALLATVDGGPVAMVFAATFPERTRALVLGNTSARLLASDDYPIGMSPELVEAFVTVLAEQWGTERFAHLALPGAREEERAWFARYQRATMTPRSAVARNLAQHSLDLRAVLPTIQVPTLVLHAREYMFPDIEHGRYLAEHIPGAKLLELAGGDGGLMYDVADVVLDAVEEFVTGTRRMPDPDRMLATVVFTDIVDSTRLAAAIGDRKWRQLLEHHDAMTRAEIARFGGRMWKSTGDGALATFDAPSRAIRCSLNLQRLLRQLDLDIRVGVHAGEIEVAGGEISGLSVHIAARVLDAAAGGTVMVSRTVADLIAGGSFSLIDQGPRELKGVPGEWSLYRLEEPQAL